MRTIQQIEYLALGIIDSLKNNQPVEHSVVELKAILIPNHNHIARRLAGHANAARGNFILWLIGVNEDTKQVEGVQAQEFSTWWAKIKSEFESVVPSLTDVIIYPDGKAVLALYFETDRAPYVVKVKDGKEVKYETPWREGTSVRSATHSDLIKLLIPVAENPLIRVKAAHITLQDKTTLPDENKILAEWICKLSVYITPQLTDNHNILAIPHDQISISFAQETLLKNIAFPYQNFRYSLGIRSLISDYATELIVNGPGTVTIEARIVTPHFSYLPVSPELNVDLYLSMITSNGNIPVFSDIVLRPAPGEHQEGYGKWVFGEFPFF